MGCPFAEHASRARLGTQHHHDLAVTLCRGPHPQMNYVSGRIRPNLIIALLAHALLAISPAVAGDDYGRGFGFCPLPARPACMSEDATFADPSQLEACQARVQIFVGSLAAYRTCLRERSERTLSEANDEIFAFRCRVEGRPAC